MHQALKNNVFVGINNKHNPRCDYLFTQNWAVNSKFLKTIFAQTGVNNSVNKKEMVALKC